MPSHSSSLNYMRDYREEFHAPLTIAAAILGDLFARARYVLGNTGILPRCARRSHGDQSPGDISRRRLRLCRYGNWATESAHSACRGSFPARKVEFHIQREL